MDSNWTDGRAQLDQVLAREWALHQARRQRQPAVGQRLRQWWAPVLFWFVTVFTGI